MPIYEYECAKCGERFELRRSIADSDSDTKCPKCSAENTRRVLSVFATGSSSTACAPSSPT
ncbi:MAG: zinc ribbon domain-containing protein [Dehalococcoidia bacterium]